METEFFQSVIRSLVAGYVFVATLWAICLPSIRAEGGKGHNYFYVPLATILAVFLLMYLLSYFGLFPDIEGDAEEIDHHWTSYLLTFAWIASFLVVGVSILNGLAELSHPKDRSSSD